MHNAPPIPAGSEPALKQIFGQGFPKLHPFGLSPLIPDLILATATCFFWTGPQIAEVLDQGSVLVVRVFGSLSIYFTPQPEVVPVIIN
jgi:hypothetical protein